MRLRLFVLPLWFGACAPSSGYVATTYAPDVYLPPPAVVHERVYVAPRYDVWSAPPPHPHHRYVPYHHHPRVEQAPPAYGPSHGHAYGAHQAPPASGPPRGRHHPH